MFKPKSNAGVEHFRGFGAFSALFFIYLYAPIVILVIYSFNANISTTVWTGFSLDWYRAAFANEGLRGAAINSVIIALTAGGLSTVIATLAALATSRRAQWRGKTGTFGTIMLPLLLPEIVIGVALLTFFTNFGLSLGRGNLMIAHVVFCIPFSYLPIRARLDGMDDSLEQAAMDLYSNEWRTFYRVTLPILLPGIVSGAMLAFIVSMDNFIISLLVAEAGSSTLPIFIFGMVRMGVTPEVNAVSTVILFVSVAIFSLAHFIGFKR
jgi:spermidine/putrescine transport system permease protein|tara:strand:- start:5388 stop:6185 length:798 start_codon:yes stop_codon:yes gene_type:complete